MNELLKKKRQEGSWYCEKAERRTTLSFSGFNCSLWLYGFFCSSLLRICLNPCDLFTRNLWRIWVVEPDPDCVLPFLAELLDLVGESLRLGGFCLWRFWVITFLSEKVRSLTLLLFCLWCFYALRLYVLNPTTVSSEN